MGPPAWELPYAAGAALKSKKQTNKKLEGGEGGREASRYEGGGIYGGARQREQPMQRP